MAKLTIDPRRQLAQRRATKATLDRFFISRKTYAGGRATFRILMGGELYDVDEPQLAAIKRGLSPGDLDLDAVEETDQ